MWVSVALLVLACGLTLRWTRSRVDALGRAKSFPAIGVSLCLVSGVGAAIPVALHARTERRLSAAASVVAGIDATVHCQTVGEASLDLGPELGFVKFDAAGVPEHHALMKWQPCRDIVDWMGSDRKHPSRDQMIAVHVLAHEAMHMAGATDEALTECRAMQRDAAMADQLGATPVAAKALAVRYWHEVYPDMPENYRSGECRPGGALDEQLPNAPWN